MAQANKGPRRTIQARVPLDLAERIEELAEETGRNMSELLADWAADGLGLPRPSSYLPQPKKRIAKAKEQEAIDFQQSA